MRFIKLRPSSLLDSQLVRKNYIQISIFSDPIIVKGEKVFCILKKKAIKGAISKVMRS